MVLDKHGYSYLNHGYYCILPVKMISNSETLGQSLSYTLECIVKAQLQSIIQFIFTTARNQTNYRFNYQTSVFRLVAYHSHKPSIFMQILFTTSK